MPRIPTRRDVRRARAVVHRTAVMGGLDTRRLLVTVRALPAFARSYRTFQQATEVAGGAALPLGELFPITADAVLPAGDSGAYFLQDLWAARLIHTRAPARHVDVGSRLDGFVAHLLVFREVEAIDIRPLDSPVDGLTFTQEDATTLASIPDGSIESLSSLHAVEHFGLGRYGDPLDPLACFSAMRSLARVLAPGGYLYFSVPIGRERVEFNAHRILDPRRVIAELTGAGLELVATSAIDTAGRFVADADLDAYREAHEVTGLFELRKPHRR